MDQLYDALVIIAEWLQLPISAAIGGGLAYLGGRRLLEAAEINRRSQQDAAQRAFDAAERGALATERIAARERSVVRAEKEISAAITLLPAFERVPHKLSSPRRVAEAAIAQVHSVTHKTEVDVLEQAVRGTLHSAFDHPAFWPKMEKICEGSWGELEPFDLFRALGRDRAGASMTVIDAATAIRRGRTKIEISAKLIAELIVSAKNNRARRPTDTFPQVLTKSEGLGIEEHARNILSTLQLIEDSANRAIEDLERSIAEGVPQLHVTTQADNDAQ